jgi:hypothetical protein
VDHVTQVRLTKKILAHLDDRTTDQASDVMYHATAAYHSPERLQLEKKILYSQIPFIDGFERTTGWARGLSDR